MKILSMCRTNTPSQQGRNSYNHDSSCFGHRVELNTEAREEGGELYCLLLRQDGNTTCITMTVVAMATGWS